ncbi:MAG: thioredoxin domain-containing protein, partial [Acidobacteria bacterium]|nr:thioredoxin domain-containing protein [Acidobacteriota bacterium]
DSRIWPRLVRQASAIRSSRVANPLRPYRSSGGEVSAAEGGMRDELGGGFHRYSVDERWFLPHFEKMLYDQAQLAVSLLEAFQITHEPLYASVAGDILDYVLRDMRDPAGGFYSAEDADSIIDPAFPGRKGEGAFYIWRQPEIEAIAGQPAAEWFCFRYGVLEAGNVSEDPHGEFEGENILYQAHSLEETAEHFGKPLDEVRSAVLQTERQLLGTRSRRPRPHRDEKVLTAWNGLMLSALAKGGAILSDQRYTDAARAAADFLTGRMYDRNTGVLLRRYREGDAAISGFLDDYAFLIQGLLDLYEAAFHLPDLETAGELARRQIEIFEDKAAGGFFTTGAGDPSLVLRMKDDYDGAEPSGNSIAALNLLRLAQITNSGEFREAAARAMRFYAERAASAPEAMPQMLAVYEFSLARPRQVILVGEGSSPDTAALVQALYSRFVPNKIVLLVDDGTRERLSAYIPAIQSMEEIDGRPAAYVCEDYTCKLPTADPGRLAELLQ